MLILYLATCTLRRVSVPEGLAVRLRLANLTWREVEGEIVALDLVSSTYFTTNRTGTLLWTAMVDGTTVGDLVTLLQDRFGLSEEQAEADVRAFLALLSSNQLLDQTP